MPLQIIGLTPLFAVSPQLGEADFAEVVARGFTTVINNRPDGEGGPAQPASADLQRAAIAAGLRYVYLPVVSGSITAAQVSAMRDVLLASAGMTLAFCRSGSRSAQLFGLAQAPD